MLFNSDYSSLLPACDDLCLLLYGSDNLIFIGGGGFF